MDNFIIYETVNDKIKFSLSRLLRLISNLNLNNFSDDNKKSQTKILRIESQKKGIQIHIFGENTRVNLVQEVYFVQQFKLNEIFSPNYENVI